MTAQVIFLNTGHFPDEEEMHELDKMQEFLTYAHHQYEYERRGLDRFIFKKQKEETHKRARERLSIVKNQDPTP